MDNDFFINMDLAILNIRNAIIEGFNLKVEDNIVMNLYLAISNVRNVII